MRGKGPGLLIAVTATLVALTGCAPASSASTLTVTPSNGGKSTVTVGDVRCVTSPDKFTASSTERSDDLALFTATTTTSTDSSITWVSLGDDEWFLTTDAFTHEDGSVTFDDARGQTGSSRGGDYPTEFTGTATLAGTVACTRTSTL